MIAIATALLLAGAPDSVWARAQPINITMTDHGFVPRRVVLRRGAPYVLRVVNRSGKGHNLTQTAFFDSARVAPADRPLAGDGKIVVPAGGRASVRLFAPMTRPGGTYQFSSTVLADAADDYKGVFAIR